MGETIGSPFLYGISLGSAHCRKTQWVLVGLEWGMKAQSEIQSHRSKIYGHTPNPTNTILQSARAAE